LDIALRKLSHSDPRIQNFNQDCTSQATKAAVAPHILVSSVPGIINKKKQKKQVTPKCEGTMRKSEKKNNRRYQRHTQEFSIPKQNKQKNRREVQKSYWYHYLT